MKTTPKNEPRPETARLPEGATHFVAEHRESGGDETRHADPGCYYVPPKRGQP